MSKSIGEAIFCAVLIGLVGFALTESFQIRGSAAGGSLSPAFFPKAICILLLAFLVVSLIGTVRKTVAETSGLFSATMNGVATFAWMAILAELIAYALILEPLGYVVSTTLMIFSVVATLATLNGPQGGKITAKGSFQLGIFSLVVALTIHVLFSQGFGLVLPTLGVLGV
ncbi:hypothetical protein HLV40_16525 [Chromohalobacter salexigens]|nr:hypothetical protein [Chromohalobacter salexigens]